MPSGFSKSNSKSTETNANRGPFKNLKYNVERQFTKMKLFHHERAIVSLHKKALDQLVKTESKNGRPCQKY